MGEDSEAGICRFLLSRTNVTGRTAGHLMSGSRSHCGGMWPYVNDLVVDVNRRNGRGHLVGWVWSWRSCVRLGADPFRMPHRVMLLESEHTSSGGRSEPQTLVPVACRSEGHACNMLLFFHPICKKGGAFSQPHGQSYHQKY
jgi:hypothetical protein